MPESALCAYVEYLTKTYKSDNLKIKALRRILEINPNRYVANVNLGGICYDEKKWNETLEHYNVAVDAGEVWRTDWVYFRMAWCCGKARK